MGRYLKRGLFFEQTSPDARSRFTPPFTLKEEDHEVDGVIYRSMRRMYLEYSDPTEYEFATAVLGSWDHWTELCDTAWFSPYVSKWRDELEVKVRSQAIKALQEHGKTKEGAAKYLAEAGWKPKRKAGRPTKAEVEGERKRQAFIDRELEDFATSVGIHVKH